jgi:molybdopterin/thiamine biosynthesis adenylyltransferase
MPKAARTEARITLESAAEAIESHLGPQAIRLGSEVLRTYAPFRKVRYGWQILVQFSDAPRQLNILLTADTPFRPPLIALADPPPKLIWPHVEDDGVLCLLPESAAVDYTTPVPVLDRLLGEAVPLIEACIGPGGQPDAEFRREFLSYWGRAVDNAIPAISLLRPEPPSRAVRVWQGDHTYVFGEDDNAIVKWMSNRWGPSDKRTETSSAGLVWLNEPIAPKEYPANGAHLKELLHRADSSAPSVVQRLIREDFRSLLLVLAAPTDNGPCFCAVELRRPTSTSIARGNIDVMTNGFRRGHVPPSVVLTRALSQPSAVSRIRVERADVDWVHNRGQDGRIRMLNTTKVLLIGCGSLGGAVAEHIAMAGVGHLVLFDSDILSWPNTGRHPLGASYVGVNKAIALAEELRKRLPHIIVEPIPKRWQEADDWSSLLSGCSLIVSATGDWASDAALNVRILSEEKAPPAVYGWIEAQAAAGHAVAIVPGASCFQCGFHPNGKPKIQATTWSQQTLRQEPACGAAFQPYGPIELSHSVALLSDLALDCLFAHPPDSTHRIWFGSTARLHELGGQWDNTLADKFGDPGPGERVARSVWVQDPQCPMCSSR